MRKLNTDSFSFDLLGIKTYGAADAYLIPKLNPGPIFVTVDGTSGDDMLDGTVDADTINGFDGNDTLNGLDGGDVLNGDAGNDVLNGGNGDDILNGGLGDDTFNGGAGNDAANIASGINSVNLGSGADTLTLASGLDFTGSSFNGGNDSGNRLRFDGSNAPGTFDLTTGFLTHFDEIEFVGTTSGTANILFYKAGNFSPTRNVPTEIIASSSRALGETIDIVFSTNAFSNNINMSATPYTGLVNGVDTITFELFSGTTIRSSDVTDFNESFISYPGRGISTIYAYGGDDFIQGAYGQDTVYAGDGNDTVIGGDTIGSTIRGEAGDDDLTGGLASDTIYGGDDADIIDGAAGNDVLYGDAGVNTIGGGTGLDTIYGGDDGDTINGGDGNDSLYAGAGTDIIDGGADFDTVYYTDSAAGVTLYFDGSLPGSGGDAQGDVLTNVERIYGSNLDDVVYGASGDNDFYGQGGADIYYAVGGADYVNLGSGADILHLVSGTDYTGAFFDGGNDAGNTLRLDGSNAPGTFDLTTGTFTYFSILEFVGTTSGTANILFYKGGNFLPTTTVPTEIIASSSRALGETIDIVFSTNAFSNNINMSATPYTGLVNGVDTITFELFSGTTIRSSEVTDFNESFISYPGRGISTIYAYGGDDFIQGAYGQDTVYAGDGNDTVIGGDTIGSTIRGETGDDDLTGGVAGDTIYGGDDADTIDGAGGNDALYGDDGDDDVDGGAGTDSIYGSSGADQIDGGDDYDTVYYTDSAAGITLYLDGTLAGVGSDAQGDTLSNIERIYGSNLDDVFYGSATDNDVYGQGGADTFYAVGGADFVDLGGGTDILSMISGTDYTGASYNGGTDAGNILRLDGSNTPGTFDLTTGTFTYFNNIEFAGTTSGTLEMNMSNTLQIASITASATRAPSDTIDITLNSLNFGSNIVLTNATYTGLTSGVDIITISYFSFAVFSGSNLTDFNESFVAVAGRGASTLYGYGGDDFFQGSFGQDDIYAGDGNDTVIGGGVGNTIRGESGDDDLTGGAGNDAIYGGADDDIINGGAGNDTIYDEAGADVVNGGEGNDTVYAGDSSSTGIDTFDGGDGTDLISFLNNTSTGVTILGDGSVGTGDTAINFENYQLTNFQDTFFGDSSAQSVSTFGEDDVIYHGGGVDTVFAGAGDDIIVTRAGENVTGAFLTGEAGTDTLQFEVFDGSTIDMTLANNIQRIEAVTIAGDNADGEVKITARFLMDAVRANDVQSITMTGARTTGVFQFTVFSDSVGPDMRLVDFVGFDLSKDTLKLEGGVASQTFYGTQQSNIKTIVEAGGGNDTIFAYTGNDEIYGEDGNDTVGSHLGADYMDGGAGVDWISYSRSTAGVTVNLASGAASGGDADGDTVLNFERLRGSQFDDNVTGNDEDNVVNALNGNDTVIGGDGADILNGQNGNDTLNGGDGNDMVVGGTGSDIINGGAGDDVLTGQAGADTIIGGNGNDTINGSAGSDNVSGGADDDFINGGGGNDILNGNAGEDNISGAIGSDTINGGGGNDTLFGNNQNDIVYGDGGDDVIDGGAGNDQLFGGSNNDTIIGLSGQDVIYGDAGNDNLSGDGGGDDLFGGDGIDTLNGGGGNDNLNGGTGVDTFVFETGSGTDRIQDFEDGVDLIDMSGNVLANVFADISAAATQLGANVRIELNANNVLIIENVNLADLDASDFIF